MAIYRKKDGKVWYAEVYVREKGKAVRFSTHKTDEAEAREVERLFRAAHNRSLSLERLHAMLDAMYGAEEKTPVSGTPLSEAYTRYREQLESTGRAPAKKTLAARRSALQRFLSWREEGYPSCLYCRDVTRTVAGMFSSAFNAEPGLSDKSKYEVVSDLGTIWNVLMAADETISENPWRFFRKRVRDRRVGMAFTEEQERKILEACAGTEWHTACVVSRWTGLRLKDVCRLKWSEVDMTERVIRLVPAKTSSHNISVAIPMSEALAQTLAAFHTTEEYVMPTLARGYPNLHSSKVGPFSQVLEKANIGEGYTFHSWRHTFASRLADAGVSTELIKKMGGWTQTATALRYQHSERIEELREAISRTERQLVGPAVLAQK